jgi:hypothetical protein
MESDARLRLRMAKVCLKPRIYDAGGNITQVAGRVARTGDPSQQGIQVMNFKFVISWGGLARKAVDDQGNGEADADDVRDDGDD